MSEGTKVAIEAFLASLSEYVQWTRLIREQDDLALAYENAPEVVIGKGVFMAQAHGQTLKVNKLPQFVGAIIDRMRTGASDEAMLSRLRLRIAAKTPEGEDMKVTVKSKPRPAKLAKLRKLRRLSIEPANNGFVVHAQHAGPANAPWPAPRSDVFQSHGAATKHIGKLLAAHMGEEPGDPDQDAGELA